LRVDDYLDNLILDLAVDPLLQKSAETPEYWTQYSRVSSGLHHKLLFAHGEHFIAVFVGLVPAETERSFGTEIADVAVKTRITVHPFLVLV